MKSGVLGGLLGGCWLTGMAGHQCLHKYLVSKMIYLSIVGGKRMFQLVHGQMLDY